MDEPSTQWSPSDLKARLTTSKSPRYALAKKEPAIYLADGRFHRSLRCPRTDKRVTFAEIGPSSGSPVLVFLPSVCTRYVAIYLDLLAEELGVRLIAMDRPGCGGTERCELRERLDVACMMTRSLVEHLNLTDMTLLACSAGFIHLLEYMRRYSGQTSASHPTVILVSPWVPGNRYLSLIPAPLIEHQDVILPSVQRTVGSTIQAYGRVKQYASRILPARKETPQVEASKKTNTASGEEEEGKKKRKKQKPPTTTLTAYSFALSDHSGESEDLVSKYRVAESMQGMGQEHLLCLGKDVPVQQFGDVKCKVGSREWMQWTLAEIGRQVASTENTVQKVEVHVWWGEKDGLVPKSARDYLDQIFTSESAMTAFSYHPRVLPGVGHDDPVSYLEGVGEALWVARRRAEEAALSIEGDPRNEPDSQSIPTEAETILN
ncbi:hypothetical protein PUNSTDRAFT_118188 [Punctularia strigosozonata HHB-11173 SS5]|uniref:uncharacterized protein n=1 Tax=Punctularia strigosozonata (strain HHB-11173) TaxID=741275 RepID=UPI0004417C14|nr:uncharacterized protein PUNSTDRAFT_118188 [Punctularia strigosozonata HHB-11173 SS5]EIN12278.1 hypothetical protein PUNSTDRAFT_118188 [Punctularia strigosozonata HHB-11173 SS5]